jgi:two-component system sensor histidine kinase RegB
LIADRSLDQAITNILNNAADASPNWVSVNARWTQQRLELEIHDRGPGLDADAKASIGKTLYSNTPSGLGLGLYLAHSAIERLGGDIEYGERPDGRGTCTRISLPLIERATP